MTALAVFPTPVGVFLEEERKKQQPESLPHARGGVSFKYIVRAPADTSSPRPWGCFCVRSSRIFLNPVFPTPVGVFLAVAVLDPLEFSLPHARGGVSLARLRCSV